VTVVGSGDFAEAVVETICDRARGTRVIMPGSQTGQDLFDAYAAMDVFAFSSQSETQGMVLAEAMAARTPVIALDGPGVRDVLNDSNGRMLPRDASEDEFAAALSELTHDRKALRELGESARRSIRDYGLDVCADHILGLYDRLIHESSRRADADPGPWDRLLGRLEIEWNLFVEKTSALTAAVVETDATRTQLD
jgi:glycosyltransferase involved in cell wall biosynthesis